MSTDRDDVEAVIGSILATEREGLSLQRLDGEYRSIVGYQIPFGRLGHTSLTAFLKSIPNVVALHRHLDGTVTAYGAHNAATAHVTKLVAQQKPSKNRRGAGPMRGRQSQHAQRPCHWQVHPYRKTGQQNRNNWNAQGAQRTNYQVGANNPPALAPKGGPKASARAPLRELPSNFQIQGNPLSTNTPARHQGFQPCPGRPFATSSEQELGIQRPDLRTWLTFLAGTGLAAFKVPIYAEMLLRQGVDPGCLWLFTAQDIRRMGIVDAQDVRLLQDRAHAVRTVLGPAAADNPLGDPPCGAPSERWQGNVHVGNVNQWPEQPNQRQVSHDPHATVRSGCSYGQPGWGRHDHTDLNESQEWLEDDRLHLTPPLRRSRALRIRHGLQVTPLHLTSVVERVSVKERLGWRC